MLQVILDRCHVFRFFKIQYNLCCDCRHDDLKAMLDSSKDNLKLDAMKRIVGVGWHLSWAGTSSWNSCFLSCLSSLFSALIRITYREIEQYVASPITRPRPGWPHPTPYSTFIYYNLMAVSKVKAIRTICKRVTATPYKNKSPYLK